MNNNSHIHIENHVSVNQSGHDYAAANASCAGLAVLGTLAGIGALGFGLYLVAEPALTLALDVAFAVGDMIGTVATGAIELYNATGHAIATYGPTALWMLGAGCLLLVLAALITWGIDLWLEGRSYATARLTQPPAQRVLIVVADREQAQEAIKLLPASASVEFIQMPAQKQGIEVQR